MGGFTLESLFWSINSKVVFIFSIFSSFLILFETNDNFINLCKVKN